MARRAGYPRATSAPEHQANGAVAQVAAVRRSREDLNQPVRRLQRATGGADRDAPSWNAVAESRSGEHRGSMSIWMLPLVFVGGLALTVLVLVIASWVSELLSDSPHLAEGPSEDDHSLPRHTHQCR